MSLVYKRKLKLLRKRVVNATGRSAGVYKSRDISDQRAGGDRGRPRRWWNYPKGAHSGRLSDVRHIEPNIDENCRAELRQLPLSVGRVWAWTALYNWHVLLAKLQQPGSSRTTGLTGEERPPTQSDTTP